MRTSGGEGVTMAVIIAALMLSMRNPSRKEQTFLIIDNIFAKVVEPSLLRLIRQVARGLRVQLILLTASRDPHALSVFSSWVQLKVQEAGPRVLVVPEAAVAADIPRQLRREPLVATTTPVILDTATARISITDSSLGTSDPSNPDVAIDDDVSNSHDPGSHARRLTAGTATGPRHGHGPNPRLAHHPADHASHDRSARRHPTRRPPTTQQRR